RPLRSQPGQHNEIRNSEPCGKCERRAIAPQSASRQHEYPLRVECERDTSHHAAPKRPPPPREPDRGQMGREHQQISRQRRHSRRRIEYQKKRHERRGPRGLRCAPQPSAKPPRDPAGKQRIQRPSQAQRPPWPCPPNLVHLGQQRRLVEPDIAIQRLASAHLNRSGQGQALLRPKNLEMTKSRGEKAQKQDQEKARRLHQPCLYLTEGTAVSSRSNTLRNSAPCTGSARANSTNVSK